MREMMLAIFRYIDRMVTEIAKPKKLLFMAIDGVAPRAKLNQQRARRFRAAQERTESITKSKQRGETVDEENMFDSNCITPGTEFMEIVGKHLRWFIRKKIKEDSLWRNLEIVFSGHDVPGEGEHKIMQYIREARALPGYAPNQRHCMYGGDADLIMLGLATHEPHFTLLREVVDFSGGKGAGGKFGGRQTVMRQTKDVQYQLMNLSILREYIELDLALGCNWSPDKERLTDDFIFLTFLVGNDFLPHLPTLDIGEHAFDVIFDAYKELLSTDEGYIVHNGDIGDMARLEKLFGLIGVQEMDILANREEEAKEFATKRRRFKDANVLSEKDMKAAEEEKQRKYDEAMKLAVVYGHDVDEEGVDGDENEGEFILSKSNKKHQEQSERDSTMERSPLEGTKDYKGRYYYEKFKVLPGLPETDVFFDQLRESYLQGLIWCLAYYVKGCISWTWYFPYHYGPMLQDMVCLDQVASNITFDIGQPFFPFQQLLGCLPPASRVMLPKSYQWLMVSPESPVLEFYPLDFGIDQDGKRNPWEAVVSARSYMYFIIYLPMYVDIPDIYIFHQNTI
jgi:5'-3' exoribonuclease 1